MQREHPHRAWTCLRLALILFLLSLAALPGPGPAAAAPQLEEPASYTVMFVPSHFFRLCVGDTHTYGFQVIWNEPENPEPMPVDENGLPIPVPLKVYKARVTATNGTVQPSEFTINTTPQSFRFQYTAQTAGQETLQVTLEDGATGQASKTLAIIGTCSYDMYFFAKQHETNEYGGFEVAFNGEGSFSLDRTNAASSTVNGSGTAHAALGIWAEASGGGQQLFTCTMVPYRSDGGFQIEGTIHPDYDLLILALRFDPMTFPAAMDFVCEAVGLGTVNFNIPIDQTTSDPNELNMAGLSFPATGGVDHFNFGKTQGTVVVKLKK